MSVRRAVTGDAYIVGPACATALPRRAAGRRRTRWSPGSTRCVASLDAVDGAACPERPARRRRAPSSTAPASGWRCPATTPSSRSPAPPAAASPACSTRSPGWSCRAVGVRRPTTGVAHACVWGPRAAPASCSTGSASAPAPVHPGERARRATTSRRCAAWSCSTCPTSTRSRRPTGSRSTGCSRLVDLVVWVTRPAEVRRPGRARAATCASSTGTATSRSSCSTRPTGCSAADVPRCLADLRRLLDADGLDGPCRSRSPPSAPGPAWSELRGALERPSRSGRPRCAGWPATSTGGRTSLEPLVGAGRRRPGRIDGATAGELAGALAGQRPGCRRWPRPPSARTGTGRAGRPAGR